MSASQSTRIVVGVDGSPSSVQALKWAFGQAVLTGSAIDAVCAWHYPNTYGCRRPGQRGLPRAGRGDAEPRRSPRRGTRTRRTTPCRSARSSVKAQPAHALLEQAKGAALLVVGFRGHGGLSEALLGSVSQHVVHHAPCPVVIVRDTVVRPWARAPRRRPLRQRAPREQAPSVRAGGRTRRAWGRAASNGQARLADELGAALVQLSMVLRRAILPPQIGLTQASTLLILRDEGPQRVTSLAEAAQVTPAHDVGARHRHGTARLGALRREQRRPARRGRVPHPERRSGGLRT